MPYMTGPNQHMDNETPNGSKDRGVFPDSVKTTFNLDIESTDKIRNIAKYIGRAVVKKIVLILG